MKTPLLALASLALLSFAHAQVPRSAGFWGLHFDFHASTGDQRVGERLTEGMIDSLIRAVRPDFIQIDCKGHPGVTSYPTAVPTGTHVASFTQDPLKLWRRVTQRHGVALVMHYSGVWDDQAVKKHPAWARLDADGKPSDRYTSVFSAYTDSLLLPQLTELSQTYGVDGAWVDGDCWAFNLDYRPEAIAAFRQETGLSIAPRSASDPAWLRWRDFNRRAFHRYVARYVNGIHRVNPRFQLTSNWSFSSMMPDSVDVPVNFLSGDVAAANGVLSAAFQARCLAPQGKPWDLMAWGFNTDFKGLHVAKSVPQICQEAAQVLALGGAFQVYFNQNRDASIRPRNVPVLAEIAKFCRARQFLHHSQPRPQVALVYSREAIYRQSKNLFAPSDAEIGPFKGILTALMDAGHSVEVRSEHHLWGTELTKFPVVVVPEWAYLDEGFKKRLLAYAEGGGNLVLLGTETTRLFAPQLGVQLDTARFTGTFCYNADLSGQQPRISCLTGARVGFSPRPDVRVLGDLYRWEDTKQFVGHAATVRPLGRGRIAGLYLDLGDSYFNRRSHDLRDLLDGLLRRLYTPEVTVENTHLAHVVTAEKDGKRLVNLLNVAGPHDARNTFAYDEIPPLRNLTVRLALPKKPARVVLLPENQPLPVRWQPGQATVTVPEVKLHGVLRVE
jgi:hypothetical protein